jgi:hypothetical protein
MNQFNVSCYFFSVATLRFMLRHVASMNHEIIQWSRSFFLVATLDATRKSQLQLILARITVQSYELGVDLQLS